MVRAMVRQITGKEPELGINPDEVVAMGAAVYAANLSGVTVRNEQGQALPPVRFRNVTAHSLGVVVLNRAKQPENSKIILKDTEIPAEAKRGGYSTVEDNQTAVAVQIIQGEDVIPTSASKWASQPFSMGYPHSRKGFPRSR